MDALLSLLLLDGLLPAASRLLNVLPTVYPLGLESVCIIDRTSLSRSITI